MKWLHGTWEVRHYTVTIIDYKTPTWEPEENIGQGVLQEYNIRKTQRNRRRNMCEHLQMIEGSALKDLFSNNYHLELGQQSCTSRIYKHYRIK